MILVTGGCGYIGSHFIIKMLEQNHAIISLDNLSNSSSKVNKQIKEITNRTFKFFEGDIRDSKILQDIFSNYKIDKVVHFAGYKSMSEGFKRPIDYYSNNITGSLNLIKEMINANIKKLIFSSSATVYGDNHPLPWKEDLVLDYPANPYAQSKFIIEKMLHQIAISDNEWHIDILRYFNPIGTHKSGLISSNIEKKTTNLVPSILKVIRNEIPFLNVYGNDYQTKDGTGVRDYIHIDDLINGHISVMNNTKLKCNYNIWNLGTGKGFSVMEIIQEFERIIKRKVNIKICHRRQGDLAEYWADVDKIKQELNWCAKKKIGDMVKDSLSEFNQT